MKHDKNFEMLTNDFKGIYEWFNSLSALTPDDIKPNTTLHVIVDMINGFVKEGALSSCEVLSINNSVAQFTRFCKSRNIQTIALADEHTSDSTEFSTYPVHCLKGTAESALTDEIANADKNIIVFGKNSTNGYLEPEVSDFIKNSGKRIFIITGDCTDMCVIQFALTLKADFNRRNIPCRVIVPYDLTATCALPNHDPELAEIMALYIMHTNGIEICDSGLSTWIGYAMYKEGM